MARALDVLELLARSGGGSLPEICRALGQPKSSVYGILTTLMERGYVGKGADGHFQLQLKVVSLSSAVLGRVDVRHRAAPVMHRLVGLTEETCHLGVLDGNQVVYIERVNSGLPAHVVSHIGLRTPPDCTALGLVLLSELPESHLAALAAAGALVTPGTGNQLATLAPVLARIRKHGHAVDDGVHDPQVRSVAAPVRDYTGRIIAAISVSGLSGRLTRQRLPWFVARVLDAAGEISREMGYVSDQPVQAGAGP